MPKTNPGSALAKLRWAKATTLERKAAASKAAVARWDAYREAKRLAAQTCPYCGDLGHDGGCSAQERQQMRAWRNDSGV